MKLGISSNSEKEFQYVLQFFVIKEKNVYFQYMCQTIAFIYWQLNYQI